MHHFSALALAAQPWLNLCKCRVSRLRVVLVAVKRRLIRTRRDLDPHTWKAS